MQEWLTRDLVEILSGFNASELSAVELMQATLGRIDETRDTLNAFTAVRGDSALLEEAEAADARRRRGEARPLEGIPLGVKDLEDVAGLVTSQGSVPFKDALADRDSIQVERLRAAGAIVVGKTNTPEFGYTALTKNLLFGTSRNPWNLDRTPGGSSGGSSAAIAGGVIPMVTASDGGGSIRIPASVTGCFGLKTSWGRIPNGPKSLWTAALHLDVVSGVHPLDPNSLPRVSFSFQEILEDLPAGLRAAFSPDLGYARVQSDVAEVVEHAVGLFPDWGIAVERLDAGPPEPGGDWGFAGAWELLSQLQP